MKIGGKTVDLLSTGTGTAPLIVLNTFEHEGQAVFEAVRKMTKQDFNLVEVSNLNWDDDLSPWQADPIMKGDRPCGGKSLEHLSLIEEEILPAAEAEFGGTPKYYGIAGYSFAGLFAFDALYRTKRFSRAASVSGSMWFPDFLDFAKSHEMKKKPDCVYFSLGDKEDRTRNPILKTVRTNTEDLEQFCRSKGIASVFELNPGNHFVNGTERTAKGVAWILNQ